MPGFFITNTSRIPELKNYNDSNCKKIYMECCGWKISINTLNKYMNDKLFFKNEKRIVILDGVILNKKALLKKYQNNSWEDTVNILIEESESWFSALRGVFSGAVYDIKFNSWIVFSDQCGSHLVLKYNNNGNIAFGSQLNYFADWMKINDIKKELDNTWVDDFLYYGYMVDKHTIINGVDRIYPGTFLKCKDGKESISIYHRLKKNYRKDITIDEAIELLDNSFSNAVKRIIDKDIEYGYRTIVDISGGLDSRMNLCTALKFSDKFLGVTYAQTDSDDYRVVKKIKKVCNIESIFYPLDSGKCLLDIDDLVFMNQGMNYYYGITGGKKVLEMLDSRITGIEIWGLLGDINEGVMVQDGEDEMVWDYDRFRTIKKYSYVDSYDRETFDDREIQWFYVRGMLAGMNTGFIRQNFVEPITPYGDVEFMDVCYSLPFSMRGKSHVYRRWMKEKYPKYANIECSATGFPLTVGKLGDYVGFMRRVYRKIFKIMHLEKLSWSMNPIKGWYEKNELIREYFQKYYDENIELFSNSIKIKNICEELFKGDINEKIISLTIISAIKTYIL